MAKVKASGLRGYVGRLGGSVYYMNRGQNVARELAPEVSNPRTASQQRQRMRLANMVASYRTNRPWMGRKSFENKPRTWSDYNNFVSINSQRVPVFLSKEEAALGASVPAPYQYTKGTLPEIGVVYTEAGEFNPSLRVGAAGEENPVLPTIGELSEALLANNPQLLAGDQISFIFTSWASVSGASVPRMLAIEVILDPNDTREIDELSLPLATTLVVGEDNTLKFDQADIWLAMSADVNTPLTFTCVLSRTISGKTSVSDSHAVLNQAAQTLYARYNTQTALDNAAASYGLTEEVFLDAGYQGETAYDGGGSGTTNRITSIDYDYGVGDEAVVGTILPNGRNTMNGTTASSSLETPTKIKVHTSHEVDGSTYALQFVDSTGAATTISTSGTASGNVVSFNVPDGNVTHRLHLKAGTYSLYAGAVSLETLLAQMAVTA